MFFDAALVQHLMFAAGTVRRRRWRSGLPLKGRLVFFRLTRGPVIYRAECDRTVAQMLFGLLVIAPLAGLVKQFPWLAEFGVAGTGMTPALIALVCSMRYCRWCAAWSPGSIRCRAMCWKRKSNKVVATRRFRHVQLPLALPVFCVTCG